MQWNYILKTLKFIIISQFILNYHQYSIFLERPRSPWEVHAEPLGHRGAQVGNLCSKQMNLILNTAQRFVNKYECLGWRMKDQLDVTCYFISLLMYCTQHVSDTTISIIRSLRLCCWTTTSVVLFSVRCMLEIWCGWVWVVSVLQAEAQLCFSLQHFLCTQHVSDINISIIRSLRLLLNYQLSACNTGTTQTHQHQISNTQRTENKTDVIQQQSQAPDDGYINVRNMLST